MTRTSSCPVVHALRTAYRCDRIHRFSYLDTPLERGLSRSRVRKSNLAFPIILLNVLITRIARSRKADVLRKVYSKYGDKVEIVIVEDIVNGDFAGALDGVSAVIHAATPIPGPGLELKNALQVSGPSTGYIDSSLHLWISDHQGGSSQHRPPSCRSRCQTYLLYRDNRLPFEFHRARH